MAIPALSSTDFDRLNTLAQQQARRACRNAGLPPHQADDIRQEMLLDLLTRLAAFDPSRGNLEAFATVCFRHRGSRIAGRERRYQAALHPARLDQPVCDFASGSAEEHLTLAETIPEAEGYAAWCGQPTDAIAAAERRLDLQSASAALDARDHPLCAALSAATPHEVAAQGSVNRSTLYRRLHEMRLRLLAAGLLA